MIMDPNNSSHDYSSGLAKLLANMNTTPPNKVRLVTRRGRRSEQFSEISKANALLVDELIKIAEDLANEGHGTAAGQVIKAIRQLLENNQNLQKVVGETLLDIPN